MAYTEKFYSASGDSWIEDSNGASVGVEWTDSSGNTYRDIVSYCKVWDFSNKKVVTVFTKEIKPVGSSQFFNIGQFEDEVSDYSGYRYDDPTQMNWSSFEPSPFDAQGNLKAGLVTEAQFFNNNFVHNIHNKVLSLSEFYVMAIVNHEGLS